MDIIIILPITFGSISFYFTFILLWLVVILFTPAKAERALKGIAVFGSLLLFFSTIICWFHFNSYLGVGVFQNIETYHVTQNYTLLFGYDSISLSLLTLTTFLFPLCFVMMTNTTIRSLKYYIVNFIVLEFLLICIFLSLDFIFFYICFEGSLIPMFLLIGVWGSKERKTKAAFYLFLYTFFGSLFLLVVLLYLLKSYGTTNYYELTLQGLPFDLQMWIWPAIFVAFAIKIPMIPFHVWLPEAHVEAPTAGSVLLAGIVLKLGGYGMVRYLIPLCPEASVYYGSHVQVLALVGTIYAAIIALRQTDIKKIIAYSSVAHMNFSLLGLFSFTIEGFSGFLYMMLGHGFISSALFFLVGVLYDRHHSREYSYYSGLTMRMPLFTLFFFCFTLANVAIPGTINFVAEFLILLSLGTTSILLLFLTFFTLLFSVFYAFWIFGRIAFGAPNLRIFTYYDLTFLEVCLFLSLLIPVFFGGLCPDYILLILVNKYFIFY